MKKKLSHIFPVLLSLSLLILTGACGDDYYTAGDFHSLEKIDAHVHINVDNSVMIDQAIEDNFRLILVNVGTGQMPITEQKEIAARASNQFPDHASFITALPLEDWDDQEVWEARTLDYLIESRSEGALGVKIWKNIGMEFKNTDGEFVMVDDPQFDPIYTFLTEQNMVLFGHLGEPKNCWLPLEEMTVANDRDYFENHPQYHMYLHPEYPSYEQIIAARNNVLDKHPDLKFFGAHLGSMEWSIEMMSEHLDKYPNMVLGMAHRVPHIQYLTQGDRDKVRDFFITYQDRLLYSTDLMHYPGNNAEEVRELTRNTWREDWEFFVTDNTLNVWQVEGSFQGLKLPKPVIDKLFRNNALAFFPEK